MGILDAALHVGREATYGTPAALTRSFEAKSDAHKRKQAYLESVGMRSGMQTLRSDRRKPVNMGAEGSLEVDVLNKGLGLLLEQCFGSSAIVQEGLTAAWMQTHTTTADGPLGKSLTVQQVRPPVSGAVLPFTYHGGKATKWELTQKAGSAELLKLKLDLDYEDVDTTTAAAAPAYPATADVFSWLDCDITIAGAAVHATEFSLKGDNQLDVDRRFLRRSALKKEPRRQASPTYDGNLTAEFEDLTAYNRFVSGEIVSLIATWTGADILAGVPFLLRATVAAVQFTGDTPEVSLSKLPDQKMPFRVLHNGTDPAVKVEYRSTDTAL